MADIATVGDVNPHTTDTNSVTGSVDIGASVDAHGDVIGTADVVNKCICTDGSVGVAGRIALERTCTVRRIEIARGVVRQGGSTAGGVKEAIGVASERCITGCRIVETG